jgi:large subunit ribosomal protein L13
MNPKTFNMRKEDVVPRWYVVDATDQVLGRLAVKIARVLQGKHRPEYTPHVDTGDFVIVLNAGYVRLTGKKDEQKMYYRHTGYLGHLKEVPFAKMIEQKPTDVLRLAVRRMLPKTRLGRQMLSKLKLYAGDEHPHAAQQPQPLAP